MIAPRPRLRFILSKVPPPRRKRLTIAAGYLGMNGIVLCADTQETYWGFKSNVDKIRHQTDMGLDVAITGAGDSDLIEAVGERIEKAIFADYSENMVRFPNEILAIIQRVVTCAFHDFIAPYAAFPVEQQPSYEMLILVSVNNAVNTYDSLFKISRTVVREIATGGACIGVGLTLANRLFEKLLNPFMELDSLTLALCFIIDEIKKSVEGCGGDTHLIACSSRQKLFGSPNDHEMKLIERQFANSEPVINELLTSIINPNCTDAHFEYLITQIRERRELASKDMSSNGGSLRENLKKLVVPSVRELPVTPSVSHSSED